MNHTADVADDVLRISMDAKAIVKVGPFARGGKSRVQVDAADHDFQPEAPVTPVGILLPTSDALLVDGITSQVTRDGLVDRIVQWWETVRERFAHIPTRVINLDNGPEHHSRRTQFMQRMVEFVHQYHVHVRLAYYPPVFHMSSSLQGYFQFVQVKLVIRLPWTPSAEMLDLQSAGEQVRTLDSATNVEEEGSRMDNDHQVAIQIDAVGKVLQ